MSENMQEENKPEGMDAILLKAAAIKKELIVGLCLILIIGLGFTGYSWMQKKKEIQASTAYFHILAKWDLLEKKEALKKEDAQKELKTFIAAYSKSTSAKEAAILLANFLEQNEKEKEALEVLEMIKTKKADSMTDALYLYRLALGHERNNACDQAIQVLDRILSTKDLKILKPQSLLQKALCLEKVGRKDEARAEYKKLSSSYGDTEQGKKAEKYLILMDLGA